MDPKSVDIISFLGCRKRGGRAVTEGCQARGHKVCSPLPHPTAVCWEVSVSDAPSETSNFTSVLFSVQSLRFWPVQLFVQLRANFVACWPVILSIILSIFSVGKVKQTECFKHSTDGWSFFSFFYLHMFSKDGCSNSWMVSSQLCCYCWSDQALESLFLLLCCGFNPLSLIFLPNMSSYLACARLNIKRFTVWPLERHSVSYQRHETSL